jgi:hypothetical protein
MLFNYYPTPQHKASDCSQQYPVSVIVNFAADGRFLPVYIQFEAEDCSRYTMKVDGIRYTKEKHDYFTFCCLITNQGIQHQVLLSFYVKDCKWVLAQ